MRIRVLIAMLLLAVLVVPSMSQSLAANPTRTATATRTVTLTRTPTLTPTPNFTRTQQAENRTATANAVGATRTQQANNRTATVIAKGATATFVARYGTISRGELIHYADRHAGEAVKIQGRVFNITDDTSFQIYFEGSWDAVVIVSRTKIHVYENDWVTIYGNVKGKITFKNAYGADISQPAIINAVVVGPKH